MTDDKQKAKLREELVPKAREKGERRHQIDLSKPMQRHIVAAVLRIPGMIARVRPVLNPDYFEDDVVSDVVAQITHHYDEDKEVPSRAALFDTFPESHHEVIRRLFKEEIPDPQHTVQRLNDFANVRAMYLAIVKGADVIAARRRGEPYKDDNGKPQDLDPVELVKEAALVGRKTVGLGLDFHDHLEAGIKEILHPEQVEKLPTGLGFLDEAGVTLERGEMGCVLGASKRGKSQVLVNIAYGLLKAGYNVVYYSLEMKAEKVMRRLYTRVAGKKADIKQDPALFVEYLRARYQKFIKGRFLIQRWPAHGATPDDIRAHLSQCVGEGFKPDVIIVDYGGLLKPRTPTGEKRHDLASVFLDMRAIAGEFDVGVWTAAQANRGAVNKPVVTMADFAECFEIVQHLDVGFSICLAGQQGVVTNQGVMKIQNMRAAAAAGGLEVMSHNFATGADEWKPVLRWINNGRQGDDGFLRVRTDANGRSCGSLTTPEHRYFRPDGSTVEARYLALGDKVAGREYVMSADQEQVLVGSMLGDGHINQHGAFRACHSQAQQYYAEWKAAALGGVTTLIAARGRSAPSVAIRTPVIPHLKRLRAELYSGGKRSIPQHMVDRISDLALAVWVMDDGSLAERGYLSLCAEGFDDATLQRLRAWFSAQGWSPAEYGLAGRFRFSARDSRAVMKRVARYVVHAPSPGTVPCKGTTKRFLCPTVAVGVVRARPVTVTSVSPERLANDYRFDIEVADNHNFYLASGVLVHNCMTDEEKAANQGRFFVLASRNDHDGSTVEFEFDYSRSIITTTGVAKSTGEKRARDKNGSASDANFDAAFHNAKARKARETSNRDNP